MSDWHPDRLLPGFEAKELSFPDDYDGQVVATLVRLSMPNAARGAVLFVHGFIDYFFQRHLAERFAAEGYAFHALDLRKHGRSLRQHQHACFCRNLSEYYADLTRALEEIREPVLLAGHSTGGGPRALYAHAGGAGGRARGASGTESLRQGALKEVIDEAMHVEHGAARCVRHRQAHQRRDDLAVVVVDRKNGV